MTSCVPPIPPDPERARHDVLERIRRAQAGGTVEVPREYHRADETPADLAVLVDRLEDYKAVVHQVSLAEVATTLACLTQRRYVVPEDFPAEWLIGVQDSGLTAQELDEFDGVVTTCAVAIAETGTIILDAGPGQGRRAVTLVPDHHVVVVRAQQVVRTVPQALTKLDPRRPQTWISGPSATSDIELQRVGGVHGPRRLDVMLVGA